VLLVVGSFSVFGDDLNGAFGASSGKDDIVELSAQARGGPTSTAPTQQSAPSVPPSTSSVSTLLDQPVDVPSTTVGTAGPVAYDLSPVPPCQMHQAVSLGSSGEDVRCLQQRLQQVVVSGDEMIVDGQFGPATETAVREFQAAHDLVVDGVAGAQTAELLNVWDPAAAPAQAQFGDGLGSIEIPRIGVALPFREGIDMPILDRGPGHWPGTALPGQPGNVVLAGHRVSHNADFRHLDALSPGDAVIFTTASGRFEYHVTSVEIVDPNALWIVDQTATATATLFACHPPGSVSQRIVVHLALSA
jgi:LPXTG-site transpeptidase (sortase) family protein